MKKFRCMVCNEQRLRGPFVTVAKGERKGEAWKTCRKPSCLRQAKKGEVEREQIRKV